MSEAPEIIASGRGPKLSTCRITVQDVVPYLAWSNSRIREIMPVLRADEIECIRKYVGEHFEEVMAEDRAIRMRSEARLNSVDWQKEHAARQERFAARRAARQKQ